MSEVNKTEWTMVQCDIVPLSFQNFMKFVFALLNIYENKRLYLCPLNPRLVYSNLELFDHSKQVKCT